MLVLGSEVLCLSRRCSVFLYLRASLVVQRLKRLPAMWETWFRSLGREDPLENEMATHSSILAWEILQRSLAGYSPPVAKSRTRLSDFTFTFTFQSYKRASFVAYLVKNLPVMQEM